VRFSQLHAELQRLGYRLQDITGPADPDFQRYWLAESRISLLVDTAGSGAHRAGGDVWSITAPHPPEQVAAAALGAQRQAVKAGLGYLLKLDHHRREGWLDRRQPAPLERPNWWLYLLLVIDQHLRDQPVRQAEWAELKLWLLRQGQHRGVFGPADAAAKIAYFVADARRAGVDLAALPSADDVVRACLNAIPVALDTVAVLDDRRDLHRLDPPQLRQSRQAKNLINAAAWHLDAVQDVDLATQLRQWLNIKPRLV
jgi:hypothetical protein